jgi:hypothetical protein
MANISVKRDWPTTGFASLRPTPYLNVGPNERKSHMSSQLFNIPVTAAERAAPAAAREPVGAPAAASTSTLPAAVGVISAQQSAITFAGAPAAVTLLWKVLGAIEPSWGSSKLLAVTLSLFVGMLIYWQSAPVDGTKKEKFTGFVFALINSFAIAAAALGISSTQ